MKIITIAGNITRDAVTRTTQGGDKVTGFSVAVNDRQNATTYFDCSIWGKRGESLCQYLTRGASVTVVGEFGTREHEGKTYFTVRVAEVALQGGKRRNDDAPSSAPQGGARADLDDEIPW